jgi:hypothetical protein
MKNNSFAVSVGTDNDFYYFDNLTQAQAENIKAKMDADPAFGDCMIVDEKEADTLPVRHIYGSPVAQKGNDYLYSKMEGDFPWSSYWTLLEVVDEKELIVAKGETEINPAGKTCYDIAIEKWLNS